ncbi:flavodoxin [Sinomonas cyclohexanicum]|uniref:Flavodoxin n=1 Tax=Sinomonas cyclohexanicum TaxID=322009 RepID=A0ABM7PZG7_SINCY|nr:flavodoxin domain-containing protein [Corynebacterium cyclohexanicum]BCT77703.1 flavodoxin [Corynebacterium cyclohexanicum]
MRVLVAYASRHGATAGIAARIAERLSDSGHAVDLVPADEVESVGGYDAVVLGAAAYIAHWMKDATAFARHHRTELAERPTWLFSSGPLGTERVDAEGRDVLEAARPKEFDNLEARLHPRAVKVFFGAWDPSNPPVGFAERAMARLPKAAAALPAGDFRNWDAVDSWADTIATELFQAPTD